MKIFSTVQEACATVVVALACTAVSPAFGAIVDSQGFEDPPFSTGDLEGQNGWLAAGGGGGSATVQTAVVLTGTQAVRVDRGANSNDRWADPVTGHPTGQFVVIEWDMRVTQATGPQSFGPYFAVEAYDADSGVLLLGSLGVDATTGDVLYQDQDTGFLTESGSLVSFDAWNAFRILLDYGSDEYSVFLNGGLLATTGFVDRSFGLDDFTDADIAAVEAAGTSEARAATGTAYFDNFRVTPEPSSLMLLLGLAGMAGLIRHRWCR